MTAPRWDSATARRYAEAYGDHPSVFAVAEAAAIGPRDDVLDVGCGTASALRWAAERTVGRLFGVDPTTEMVRIARAKVRAASLSGRIVVEEAGAEALPVEDNSFDVVLAINSIPHWSDPAAGLTECLRTLRATGRLVIGGETFTEPDSIDGTPYVQWLEARGWRATRAALPEACFVTKVERTRP